MISEEKLNNLIEQLRKELGYLPEDGSAESFIKAGTLHEYRKGEFIIRGGEVSSDLYIVSSGVVRLFDMNGEKERTFAFGTPGSIFTSKFSFVMGLPSYYNVEALSQVETWSITKAKFWDHMHRFPELCCYMLHYMLAELFFQEYKNSEIKNGDARERYQKMMMDRRDLLKVVPQKVLASYLDITPEYMSKLKREFADMNPKDVTPDQVISEGCIPPPK